MSKISHLNKKGEAHMVNVGEKEISKRCAIAEGIVRVESTTIEKIKNDWPVVICEGSNAFIATVPVSGVYSPTLSSKTLSSRSTICNTVEFSLFLIVATTPLNSNGAFVASVPPL